MKRIFVVLALIFASAAPAYGKRLEIFGWKAFGDAHDEPVKWQMSEPSWIEKKDLSGEDSLLMSVEVNSDGVDQQKTTLVDRKTDTIGASNDEKHRIIRNSMKITGQHEHRAVQISESDDDTHDDKRDEEKYDAMPTQAHTKGFSDSTHVTFRSSTISTAIQKDATSTRSTTSNYTMS